MFELIRANRIRSFFLFFLMAVVLVLLGYVIGYALFGEEGMLWGMVIAIALFGILAIVSFSSGSSIVLASSNAKEIQREHHPQLYNIVEEMSLAAGLQKIPKIYIIDAEAPNAFATGLKPENAVVAVTSGLLSRLNRDELQGVVAHEMSHIINRDIRFVTLASIMLGTIVIISEIVLRSVIYGGGSRRSDDNKGGNAIIIAVAILFAILAPLLTQLLYFALSRKREYLADASAARLTRYPEGLASALEKISTHTAPLKDANKVTAPMYICNPMGVKGGSLSNLTSTHPPIDKRIKILRAMGGGASYTNYSTAYHDVTGGKSSFIPKSAFVSDQTMGIRDASHDVDLSTGKKSTRASYNAVMAANNYTFINCDCGMKLKIPPKYDEKQVGCPRCGKKHQINS